MSSDTPSSDIEILMKCIGEHYVFTNDHYPNALLETPEQQRHFATAHTLMHMNKALGKIATEVESADHGGQLDVNILHEATLKMLINTLKLAEELGLSAEDIARRTPALLK
jgi:hypothetical protein